MPVRMICSLPLTRCRVVHWAASGMGAMRLSMIEYLPFLLLSYLGFELQKLGINIVKSLNGSSNQGNGLRQ